MKHKYNSRWFAKHVIAVCKFDQLGAMAREMEENNDPACHFARQMQKKFGAIAQYAFERMHSKTR